MRFCALLVSGLLAVPVVHSAIVFGPVYDAVREAQFIVKIAQHARMHQDLVAQMLLARLGLADLSAEYAQAHNDAVTYTVKARGGMAYQQRAVEIMERAESSQWACESVEIVERMPGKEFAESTQEALAEIDRMSLDTIGTFASRDDCQRTVRERVLAMRDISHGASAVPPPGVLLASDPDGVSLDLPGLNTGDRFISIVAPPATYSDCNNVLNDRESAERIADALAINLPAKMMRKTLSVRDGSNIEETGALSRQIRASVELVQPPATHVNTEYRRIALVSAIEAFIELERYESSLRSEVALAVRLARKVREGGGA